MFKTRVHVTLKLDELYKKCISNDLSNIITKGDKKFQRIQYH